MTYQTNFVMTINYINNVCCSLGISIRGYALTSFSHQNTPSSVGKTMSKTTDYLLKLKAVGLNSDPYDLSINQWSMDIASWPEIVFLDIYTYFNTPGRTSRWYLLV